MALPPTRLTVLLGSTPHAPTNLVAALKSHGLLTGDALADRPKFSRHLAALIQAAEARPPMPGPTTSDLLAQSLVQAGYLNHKGLAWATSDPAQQQMPRGGWSTIILGLIGLRPLLEGSVALLGQADMTPVQWLNVTFGWLTLMTLAVIWTRHWSRRRLLLLYGACGIGWSLALPFFDPPSVRVLSIVVATVSASLIAVATWFESRRLTTGDRAG